MPDVRGLLADPEFNALPMERRTAILARINPGLAQEYGARQSAPDFPGKEAGFSQGKPQEWYEGAWESVRNSIFGHPDRAEAKAAGLGVTPTPAEMVDAGMTAGAFAGGPAAGAAALRGVRGVAGAVGRWATANPVKAGAIGGAVPGVLHGDPQEALTGAAIAATGGGVAGNIGALRRMLGGARAAPSAPPQAPAPPANLSPEQARSAAQKLAAEGRHEEARAVIEAFRARPTAPAVTPAPAKPDAGRAAATSHGELMAFAKSIAKEDPKVGEKIWILLDDAGKPVRRLTSDQAGAAARRGQKTTWVKNLWRAGAI